MVLEQSPSPLLLTGGTPAVVDVAAVRLFVMAVAGWWADQRQASAAYLVEGNQILATIRVAVKTSRQG